MKCHVSEVFFVFTSMQEPLMVPSIESPAVGHHPPVPEQLLQEAIPALPSNSESKVLSQASTISCLVDCSVAWVTVALEMDIQFTSGYILDYCGFLMSHQ